MEVGSETGSGRKGKQHVSQFTEDTMFGDVANISEDKYANDLKRKQS